MIEGVVEEGAITGEGSGAPFKEGAEGVSSISMFRDFFDEKNKRQRRAKVFIKCVKLAGN